jgi:hypothetical protein
MSLSPTLVRHELGDLDDFVVAEIIATGATEADILEARAYYEAAEAAERPAERPSDVAAEVVAILRAADVEDEDEDEM